MIEVTEKGVGIVVTDVAGAGDMILHLLANGLPAADIYPPSPEVQQAVLHGRH